ncbi:MAG: flavin reductase family protein [Desulfarculus sp.]|jgi:flavin reductase (DIM6/NTAB) family NADH-FMN oxidoreductase RutF|nr:MAG: flavin reductase family protein [Desulfarculus sp.]
MAKVKIGPSTHLYPKPAVLVGALVDGRANFMTASWCGIACEKPPAMSLALRKIRHTLKGINQQGTFSINLPSVALAPQVDYCGIHSGKDTDKSAVFQVFYGLLQTAPLVQECPLNFECRLLHSLDLGSHMLVVGQIMETHVDQGCLADGKPDVEKIDPLTYASGTSQYHRLGEAVGQAYGIGKLL